MSILLIKQRQYNDNCVINEIYDEIINYEDLIYDSQCGRIVTFDNNNIQIVEFEYKQWTEDLEEFNCHGDLLDKIMDNYNIESNWILWQYNAMIKLGLGISYKDKAFIKEQNCIHTNINDVKQLILQYCNHIKYVYNYDPWEGNNYYDIIKPL